MHALSSDSNCIRKFYFRLTFSYVLYYCTTVDRDEKRRQAALQRNLEYNQHLNDREAAEKERALNRRGIGAMAPEAHLPAVPPFSPRVYSKPIIII